MQTLTKGANALLTAPLALVQVVCSSPVDVCAVLLSGAGRARSDADLVFVDQQSGPGVRYVAGPAGSPATVALSLGEVPSDVDRVVVTASLDGTGPATFGTVGSLVAVIIDACGDQLVQFPVGGLSNERTLVCLEVYRRAGAWKARAVGQGYADGLAGFAAEFGVSRPAVSRTPPVLQRRTAHAEAPPPAPDMRHPRRRATSSQAPPAPDLRHPGRQPTSAGARMSPPPPPRGTPVAFPPPGAAVGGQPVRADLDNGRVLLRRQQTVSLVKTGAPPLRIVRMGLGWDPVARGADIDLNASVIAFDVRGRDVAKVGHGNLPAFDGAVQHFGDNRTGEGDADDELITIALDALPEVVEALVFTVNSSRRQTFAELRTAYCRLLDDRGVELVRYDLGDTEPRTGVLMAKLVREAGGTWSMTALGDFHDGRNVTKMVGPARAALGWR